MIKSKRHLEYLLKCSWSELQDLTSDVSCYYNTIKKIKYDAQGKPKVDAKGNTKYRILYPSQGELKKIQSKIKKSIFDKIDLPIYIQGGVKNRSNITNAVLHKGNKYFFVTDIKNFFPSISYKKVYSALMVNNFSSDVAGMITKLTTFKGNLPQGTPTSTVLSNLVFQNVDRDVISICDTYDLVYTRFVDDITISGKKDFQKLSPQIIEPIIGNGFAVSKGKTAYKIGKTDVTGILVCNNSIKTTVKFEKKLLEKQSSETLEGRNRYKNRIKNINRKKRKSVLSNI